MALLLACSLGRAAEPDWKAFGQKYDADVKPLVAKLCRECHSAELAEAEIDLTAFQTFDLVRTKPEVWVKVAEMLDSGQMPPKDSPQPTEAERTRLREWTRSFLKSEARTRAGDPGPVVLRRLNNAEYTYTLRDLTGVVSLSPAREFPVDSAAGEGFTNVGHALVMSPALLTKYLDAAKEVAEHAVLLPDGIRFSEKVTRRDWSEELLAEIREFYRLHTASDGGTRVNLQGIVFDTNSGGRLPVEQYLSATLIERDSLRSGAKTVDAIARERGLSPKYLGLLWSMLNSKEPSLLLDGLRQRWRESKPEDAAAMATDIARWQQTLWRFTSVGHIGKLNGPKAWQEPVSPLTARHEMKLKLPASTDGKEIVLYLATNDAGDGSDADFAVWERPRLVAPGRPDLLLRDVRAVTHELAAHRERIFASAAKCLGAVAEASASTGPVEAAPLAKKHGIEPDVLAAWLDYLGIGAGGPVKLGTPIFRKLESAAGYDFVKGWVGDDALSVVANSSDQHVRIPGNMKPHSVAVHPTPTLQVAIGWRSPLATTLNISGQVQHAHPECGNGVAWTLELRRGSSRQRLATGIAHGANKVAVGPVEKLAVQKGDVVSLVIAPRDGNHSCDLTAVDLVLKEAVQKDDAREWNLASDISPDILAGNPHADRHGHAEVWNFYSEPASGATGHIIPGGSLLARWQSTANAEDKQRLAAELQQLLQTGVASLPQDSADAALYRQLTSLGGPLFSAALQAIGKRVGGDATDGTAGKQEALGLDAALFGKHPTGAASVEPASLCVKAPSVIEVRLPADLVQGGEFVTTGLLHAETGREGSVQMQVLTTKPDAAKGVVPSEATQTNVNGQWTSNNLRTSHAAPIIVNDGTAARRRLETALDEFRKLFPAALCYTKIVPVDEVVTLTLYYREDDQLRRLMLNETQTARLNRLWDELHFVSHDAVALVDAYNQLWQFATQDADPKVFEPLRKPIYDRADQFKQSLVAAEPKQLAAVIAFAGRAFRRPLRDAESRELEALYRHLRQLELPHDEALRLTLAKVLVSPAFLYRLESGVADASRGDGVSATSGSVASRPVTDWELATRLSYFLWSSVPDDELLSHAAAGTLHQPDVLVAQTKRMLRDGRSRRLATEFATQWLHIYDFDKLDEKSERHFPTFAGLRGAMYEESIQFFTHLIQSDASVLDLLDADYAFLNEELAKHYGIAHVTGPEFRRVDGVKRSSRGGILTLSSTLAKQSGASRTSPILRGNWLSEVVLGEKLPRPPKNVPVLPDTVPEGLTERQLIEKHSADAACAKCHARIDPFGFALENFDAIGRFRDRDSAGLTINTRTALLDGTKIEGLDGLRSYLLTARRDDFLRQFCKKLLGYALGRSIQLSDEPLLDEMQTKLKSNDYRVWSAVEAIVLSDQFRKIRSAGTTE